MRCPPGKPIFRWCWQLGQRREREGGRETPARGQFNSITFFPLLTAGSGETGERARLPTHYTCTPVESIPVPVPPPLPATSISLPLVTKDF